MADNLKCFVCGKDLTSYIGLNNHIRIHNITTKEYYDKYLKSPDEGICPICGKETRFTGIHGYVLHCSTKCAQKEPDYFKKKNETLERNHGKNYYSSEEFLNKVRKTCLEKYGTDNLNLVPSV